MMTESTPLSGVKCGNHGRERVYHASVAEVRACFSGTLLPLGRFLVEAGPDFAEVGQRMIEKSVSHNTRMAGLREAVEGPDRPAPDYAAWATIPVEADDYAHYALTNTSGEVSFYRVRRPSVGKYAGKTYIDLEVSEETQRLPWAQAVSALNRIAADPMAAAILYGQETKRCAICHRKLTNPASRERGIGPKCAQKVAR